MNIKQTILMLAMSLSSVFGVDTPKQEELNKNKPDSTEEQEAPSIEYIRHTGATFISNVEYYNDKIVGLPSKGHTMGNISNIIKESEELDAKIALIDYNQPYIEKQIRRRLNQITDFKQNNWKDDVSIITVLVEIETYTKKLSEVVKYLKASGQNDLDAIQTSKTAVTNDDDLILSFIKNCNKDTIERMEKILSKIELANCKKKQVEKQMECLKNKHN